MFPVKAHPGNPLETHYSPVFTDAVTVFSPHLKKGSFIYRVMLTEPFPRKLSLILSLFHARLPLIPRYMGELLDL